MNAVRAIASMNPTRLPTIASLDLLRTGRFGAGKTSGLNERSSAGMTVIVDPIESFEGLVLGSCRSLNLRIGIGCSGASVAASALAASDTWPGKKIRAPTLGSSGRPVKTFNPSLPGAFGFQRSRHATSYQPASSDGLSAKFSKYVCRVEILCYLNPLLSKSAILNPLLSILVVCQAT